MRKFIVSYLRGFCFFLTLTFPFTLSAQSLAQELFVPVELTEYGSYNIHAAQAGLNEAQTREAAYYVKGHLYFKGQPLFTALTVALSIADPLEDLDLDVLQDICRQELPTYKRLLREATPPFMKVEEDGAIKSTGTNCEYYDLKAFAHVFTSEQAQHSYDILSENHKRLVTAWRRGFQDAIREDSARFYTEFPELRASRILEALLSLDDRQLASAITSWEILYDIGSINRILVGAAPYISNRKLGVRISTSQPGPVSDEEDDVDKIKEKIEFPHVVEGEGASNSAAVAYNSSAGDTATSCLQTGQPHQPWTERFNFLPYCISFKNSSNKTVPVFQVGYANTTFYNPLSASKHIASGGTADPVITYEQFLMRTIGSHYYDRTAQIWRPFSTKTYRVQKDADTYKTITRHTTDGFGDAYVMLHDPDTGEYFAVTGRRRNAENAVFFFIEEEVAISGDAELFEQNLSENTAKFWGKTYCGPDGEGGQKAAIINFQGHMHDMPAIEEFNPIHTNPAEYKFLRGDRLANAYCNKVSWASSDNGPLKGGAPLEECAMAATIPYAFDPGPVNARQRHVKHFAEKIKSQGGVATHDQLAAFATETYSYTAQALAAATAFAVQQFPNAGTNTTPLVTGMAGVLASYSGVHRGDEMGLFVYILHEEYKKYSTPPAVIAPDILSFISGSGNPSVPAAVKALDEPQAGIFHRMLEATVDIYFNNCYFNGIRRYSDAVRVVYDGETIIQPRILNGPSPIGNARNTIGTIFNAAQCSVTADGISPLSHVYLDQKYKVYQFGTSASRHSFVSREVHDMSVQHWADVLKEHNKEGLGYGGEASHVELCSFDPDNPSEAQMKILESFTVQLPDDLFQNVNYLKAGTVRQQRK